MDSTTPEKSASGNGNGNGEDNPLLVFMPSGRRGRFAKGTPILQAARSLGVDIDSSAVAVESAARCQVVVSEGEFAKLGVTSKSDHLSDFSSTSSVTPTSAA